MLDAVGVVWVYVIIFLLMVAFAASVGWVISILLDWKERRRAISSQHRGRSDHR